MAGPPTPIDYTNIGYASLREAMLELARERLPEWTDLSENDLGVLLVELIAFASDITLYYQTRIAANLLPETSDEPQALLQLLRLIGYELHPASPATANLRVSFDAALATPITIAAGTRFTVAQPGSPLLSFETPREVRVDGASLTPADSAGLRHFFPLPVVEGVTVRGEQIGVSDGSPSQRYRLAQGPVLADSIELSVAEPGGATRWSAVDSLVASSPADRHFVVQRDVEGGATLVFGDGIHGLVPPRGTPVTPASLSVRYRVGGGVRGNEIWRVIAEGDPRTCGVRGWFFS